jgi:hypothetical protein
VFTATISGTANTALNWYVNGAKNGNSTEGTLTACTISAPWQCTYTAPSSSAPSPNPVQIEVESAAEPSVDKTAAVTVTVPTPACTDTGSESLLSGQYAFNLTGYKPTGYLALIGSLTADGSGHFSAGEVDSNGALGVQSGISINTSSSSYSVGSNHLGCATIVTSFGTFNTRFSVGGITSSVATAGRLIEWDNPNSSSYFAATGQLVQQTAPTAALSGSYVFKESGVDGSGGRTGMVGVVSVSSDAFSAGELDMNDAGTTNHTTGLTGTLTSAAANGRFTLATTVPGDNSTHHTAAYEVSGSQALFVTTDAESTDGVLAGVFQLQTVPAGGFGNSSIDGNMVFYQTGINGGETGGSATVGLVSGDGAGTISVTVYEDDAGTWKTPTPSDSACGFSIDASGRMTFTSGQCQGAGYLTAANRAFLVNAGNNVAMGQVVPQTVPIGGFSATSLPAVPFYDGDTEVVSYGVATSSGSSVEVITPTGSGTVNIVGDYTSAGGNGQQADQTQSDAPIGTVGSNGTFSTNQNGDINAIMISTSEVVLIDHSNGTYPVILLLKQ